MRTLNPVDQALCPMMPRAQNLPRLLDVVMRVSALAASVLRLRPQPQDATTLSCVGP